MKIIYLTDIHGSFNEVSTLLFETVADVYIIAGDLIDIPFYNIDTAIRYHELQTELHGLRKRQGKDNIILEDFIDDLLEQPDINEDIINKGTAYQQYTIRARRVMQQKYKVLENIISLKTSSTVYTLPGNYDMDLKYTSLHERDLHLRWHQIEELKIAGYGGADVWTAGIPERYIVRHNAGKDVPDRNNELYKFFKAVRPDIIASHQPAHGIFDRITYRGPSGSPALRTYCDNNPVKLCLTGHIHNDWGFHHVDDTVYLNPSNFGEVTTIKGDVIEGGMFYTIEFDGPVPTLVTLKKLVDERIHDLAVYEKTGDDWRETVIDNARLDARKSYANYDMTVKKYSHIPEIELFKEIRKYYRMFQTQETEDRMEKMEEIVKLMGGTFDDIAMDIVGSVNMGISQKSSDIDIVLYLRCESLCGKQYDQCDYYKKAQRMIQEILGDAYKFEIIDCINLNTVQHSIESRDFECEVTQRFVAYRSICRPVNYKVIAPVEDMLNEDIEFRKEMEGSIRSYFKIFVTTSQHVRSFDKYESRLKAIGIKMPEYIRQITRKYLQMATEEE